MNSRHIFTAVGVLGLALPVAAQQPKPATTPPPSWSVPAGDSIMFGANWRMWISSRPDGWVEIFITGKPGARVPVDAIVTPTSITSQASFMRALIDPAVIERFVTEADTAQGPPGVTLSSEQYKRWMDSLDRIQIKVPTPTVRFSVGGFWMEWKPFLPRRYVNTFYQLTIGVGCANPGTLPSGGLSQSLNMMQNDSLMATLRRAVAAARRLRSSPAKIDEGEIRRRDEVLCAARPVTGNPIPHYPGRKAVYRALAADVNVDLVIDASGQVARATPTVAQSSPLDATERRIFMDEATSTLKAWRFWPGRVANGRAVPQQLGVLVRFEPPMTTAGGLPLLDSTTISPAIYAARVDTSDLLVISSRAPRGEETASRFVMTRDSVRLHVLEGGPHCGMPVVVVNYPGASVRRLGQVMEELTGGRWVVSYDLRGEGGSSPSKRTDYSIDAHVADLSAVLDSLGLPQVMLVSQGEGWKIAMTYAASHAERVAGVLTFGPADAHGMSAQTKATWIEQIRAIAIGQKNDLSGPLSGPLNAAVRELVVSDLRRADPTALAESIDKIFAYDIGPSLLAYEGPKVAVGVPGVPGQPPRADNYGVLLLSGAGPGEYATLTAPESVVRTIDQLRTDFMARTGQHACPW